jgi:hypothetical protein
LACVRLGSTNPSEELQTRYKNDADKKRLAENVPDCLCGALLFGRAITAVYCYGIRCECRLCEEVSLNLAYRWFCRSPEAFQIHRTRAAASIATYGGRYLARGGENWVCKTDCASRKSTPQGGIRSLTAHQLFAQGFRRVDLLCKPCLPPFHVPARLFRALCFPAPAFRSKLLLALHRPNASPLPYGQLTSEGRFR